MNTVIFTNASQLTSDKATKLTQFADTISHIFFSVSGIDNVTYRNIMGLDYQKVRDNIRVFMKINAGRIPCTAHMPLYSETQSFVQEWHKIWRQEVGKAEVTPMYNWGGNIRDALEFKADNSYCARLHHMTVFWDGQVSLCCMDIEGKVILGDLNQQTILEVYNGPVAVQYRKAHQCGKRREVELCNKCNMT